MLTPTSTLVFVVAAVRADRMRGGRNKFGPMYKRDRARKLQMMRQRQIAVQTIRGHGGSLSNSLSSQGNQGLSESGLSYPGQSSAQSFASLHIKQEIQIPQVSSLTSSPDSSPSPIAVALGQASASASGGVSAPPGLQLAAPTTAPGSTAASTATSLAATSDHKLWGGGTGGGGTGGGGGGNTPSRDLLDGLMGSTSPTSATTKMTPMMRDLVQSVDDREWQNSLFGLLQNQTYNQCEVDLFELMCKVLDQNLFSQVDWARNSVFFKDLKVDDQMKLLQYSWSDMLVLDHLHQRLHNQLPDETTLPNGQKFDLLCLGLLGVASLADQFAALAHQFALLKFDVSDYICLKFLLLLNPDVRGIMNRKHVQEGHNQVKNALHDYTLTNYPQLQDKFNRLLALLPDIHEMAARGEDHLYQKHCSGGAPTQTLLMEMLHAKRK
ncbi:Nuclear hormone receptor FTZ-F1 [Frankliniella fusca]|uniref:Nuclear hormone receptor FTZ-F1 n=1 Tax=Frankliniella fusca TaxID=407009 RepID=A0AAE1H7B2_9NEOP|nr:Nuclear hormone receptor FTZ-F1 [Frankliniella fusca]